jgi:hypothetical protein
MSARSRPTITEAESRFPVRVRIAIPDGGFGERLNRIQAWLDNDCGADGWAITPAAPSDGVNDAVAVYFHNAALASAFVAQWCWHRQSDIAIGPFVLRDS